MTIQASDGPIITKGTESGLGSATAVAPGGLGSGPYVSGNDNPDAGPNAFFAGSMLKDMRYRYKGGGGALTAVGYPNQAIGYLGQNPFQTIDLVPSTIATANIAALQAPVAATALALVAVSGAGITVLPAALTTLSLGLAIPVGALQIDAAPGYVGYGSSGGVAAWNCAACGRAISLTSVSNLSAINFLVSGADMYGQPQTELLAGPNNNTVNSKKTYKWIYSITPSATSVNTVSIGTADIFEFPLRADKWSQVDVTWNNARITAATGFVAADTAAPTNLTGSVRGTYAVQTASDNAKALQVSQMISPANIATQTGVFGATPA
jgi:hypothetical protein